MIPIAIFARPPIPGRCKTRLAASVGFEAAAALHAAFVEDTVARCRAVPGLAPALHVSEEHPFFDAISERFGLPRPVLQDGADLGARMAAALEHARLVVGTDAPTLPVAVLREAEAALREADLVLAPAADGGYVLVGARPAAAEILRAPSIRWSSAHTLADTIRAARGLRVRLTSPHHDVDGPDDLHLLRAQLALDPAAAPRAAAVLRQLAAIPDF